MARHQPLVGTLGDHATSTIHVYCIGSLDHDPSCWRSVELNVEAFLSRFGADYPLERLRRRFVCSRCGNRALEFKFSFDAGKLPTIVSARPDANRPRFAPPG